MVLIEKTGKSFGAKFMFSVGGGFFSGD